MNSNLFNASAQFVHQRESTWRFQQNVHSWFFVWRDDYFLCGFLSGRMCSWKRPATQHNSNECWVVLQMHTTGNNTTRLQDDTMHDTAPHALSLKTPMKEKKKKITTPCNFNNKVKSTNLCIFCSSTYLHLLSQVLWLFQALRYLLGIWVTRGDFFQKALGINIHHSSSGLLPYHLVLLEKKKLKGRYEEDKHDWHEAIISQQTAVKPEKRH